jgi:broad specificity phosphatase PhoE
MTIRLTFACAAAGPAVREARFGDGPLDERGRREALAAAPAVRRRDAPHFRSPSARCGDTTEAWGLDAVVEPALRDCDFGTWTGRTAQQVALDDPDGFRSWTTDPEAAPHGGDSVRELRERIADWMGGLPSDAGRVLAVVEPAAVRVAVVHAVGAPLAAFWRIDVPPLASVELTGRAGRWNLRLGPAAPPA